MPRLAGRVRIPFKNNVIDIAQQIRLDDNKVYTYCMSTSVRTYFVRTACVHRPKRSSYVRNLSGGVSIPFNYYRTFLKQRIHFYENRAYAYCMSTCTQRAAASVLRT